MGQESLGRGLEQLEITEGYIGAPNKGGKILAWGDTVPTDEATGYATGCLFLHTDGGDGTSLYVNEGDASSCDFNAVTVGA